MIKNKILSILLFVGLNNYAQLITINQVTPWLESAHLTWNPVAGVDSYNVYYTGGGYTNQLIDTQLIRSYGTFFRADIIGLQAGNYTFKVAPVTAGVEGVATTSTSVTVLPHDRNGFAHSNGKIPGAYNLNGTLKSNAVVIYITEQNKNTISFVVNGASSNPCIGLQKILDGFKRGIDTRPLCIRMIGLVTPPSNIYNGDIVIENNNNTNASITFEGIGSDATIKGWGIRVKKGSNIEIRNLGLMLTNSSERDNIGLQQDNNHIWVHNCDLFYGNPGSASDQAKGDGALDCKKSTNITFSYNHFWDTGKSCLLGLGENTTNGLFITYHHNWFDHSDSRHPRVRFFSAHIYNNYFDGNSVYGIGSTLGSSLFVEGNYFRNTGRPMMISKQGTDVLNGSVGTFSGENGGNIKAFNNFMIGQTSFLPYHPTSNPTHFDAFIVTTRNQIVPNNVTSLQGGATYNNFDTNSTHYISNLIIDSPEVGRDKAIQFSGRMHGGDISWSFNNSIDDASNAVNIGLLNLLQNYTSNLVFVQGISNQGTSTQTLDIPVNNEQTVVSGTPINPMVFTWGGTANDVTVTGLPSNGINFIKSMTNKTITVSGSPTNDVSFTITTVGTSGTPVSGDGEIFIDTGGGNPNPSEMIHNFTVSGLTSNFYTFTGANMNSTPGNTTFDGLTLTARLKIESNTNISYTTSQISTLTLVLDPGFTGRIKLDNVSYTAVNGVVTISNVPTGNHSITKDNTANLYYIKTVYTNLSVINPDSYEKLVLFPNPSKNIVYLKFTNLEDKIDELFIYNYLGQTIIHTQNFTNEFLDVSDFTNGMYIIKIVSGSRVFEEKLYKN